MDAAHMSLVVGDVRGYRWWRVGSSRSLVSPFRGECRWDPGINVARCFKPLTLREWVDARRRGRCSAPNAGCACGFYALHDLPAEEPTPPGSWDLKVRDSGHGGLIFGIARASGRVLLARAGWRAERAEIQALFVPEDARGDLGWIESRYGVPVYQHLDAMVAEWGPDGTSERLLRSA